MGYVVGALWQSLAFGLLRSCSSAIRANGGFRRLWGMILNTASTSRDGDIIRFRLSSPSRPYDPLVQAIRPDLADIAEAHAHFAPHYAEPAMTVTLTETCLFAANDEAAEVRATLPAGTGFALLDVTGDWAWGYVVDGHRVGYVRDADLSAPAAI
jgi:hypothetical protein